MLHPWSDSRSRVRGDLYPVNSQLVTNLLSVKLFERRRIRRLENDLGAQLYASAIDAGEDRVGLAVAARVKVRVPK